jgi:hypothetical protein
MCHQCLQNSTTCTLPIGKLALLTPIGTKWVSHYPTQNGLADLYKYKNIKHSTHGTSRAPLVLGPLSAGGPPPAGGPPGPGGSHPVIATRTTVALWIRVRNSAGPPTYCSRFLSSWIWDHMPLSTPCSTTSNRRKKPSKSLPAFT